MNRLFFYLLICLLACPAAYSQEGKPGAIVVAKLESQEAVVSNIFNVVEHISGAIERKFSIVDLSLVKTDKNRYKISYSPYSIEKKHFPSSYCIGHKFLLIFKNSRTSDKMICSQDFIAILDLDESASERSERESANATSITPSNPLYSEPIKKYKESPERLDPQGLVLLGELITEKVSSGLSKIDLIEAFGLPDEQYESVENQKKITKLTFLIRGRLLESEVPDKSWECPTLEVAVGIDGRVQSAKLGKISILYLTDKP